MLHVAIIGAGVAGLVTARELRREGQNVVVFEKSDQIGGTWAYTPEVDDDSTENPHRKTIHSSLYNSLRTNLPRQLMGFTDHPFPGRCNAGSDEKLYFPSHQEMLQFLKDFATHFGIYEFVEFDTQVIRVEKDEDDKWAVEWRRNGVDNLDHGHRRFDAVVVCNGHNSKPRWAQDLPGISKWPGRQIHSHNYRVPEPYKDQVVVVIGGGPSAYDIAFDISKVAREVHISNRNHAIEVGNFGTFPNVWQHFKVENCHENGEVSFKDGTSVVADIILHCIGYEYDFPFLKTNGIVSVDDNRVGPLYKHVFPPKLAPSLSFVGIPKKTVNFLMMELQAKWVACVVSGKVTLASEEEMRRDVELSYRLLEENGVPKHHTHTLPVAPDHVCPYLAWLAAQVGLPPIDGEHKVLLKRVAVHAEKIIKTREIGQI